MNDALKRAANDLLTRVLAALSEPCSLVPFARPSSLCVGGRITATDGSAVPIKIAPPKWSGGLWNVEVGKVTWRKKLPSGFNIAVVAVEVAERLKQWRELTGLAEAHVAAMLVADRINALSPRPPVVLVVGLPGGALELRCKVQVTEAQAEAMVRAASLCGLGAPANPGAPLTSMAAQEALISVYAKAFPEYDAEAWRFKGSLSEIAYSATENASHARAVSESTATERREAWLLVAEAAEDLAALALAELRNARQGKASS